MYHLMHKNEIKRGKGSQKKFGGLQNQKDLASLWRFLLWRKNDLRMRRVRVPDMDKVIFKKYLDTYVPEICTVC